MTLTTKTFFPFSPSFSLFLVPVWRVSDAFNELDASTAGSVHEEEAIVDEQKDDGKLGFCEIQ